MASPLTRRALLSLAAASACAQDEELIFRADVKVVNLQATVRAKNGGIVRDLRREEFEIREEGRPQELRYFAAEGGVPLAIGLLIDTSMSQARLLDAERTASYEFLDHLLREDKDQAFLIQFDMRVRVPQGLTPLRRKLAEALQYVDRPTEAELRAQSGGGTLFYDAVDTAASVVLKDRPGRKAVVALTDGVDFGSSVRLDQTIQAALKADLMVYTILYADSGFAGMGEDGSGKLRKLAQSTGGRAFEVSKKRPVGAIFAEIEEELRSQYSLGFVSDRPPLASQFRRLELKVKRPGLVAQTRQGYWARR